MVRGLTSSWGIMIRFFVFFALISAILAQTIDKNVFKNCSRIDFCTRLRNTDVDEKLKYSADIKSYNSTKANIIVIPLKNGNGNKLNLVLSLLKGNKIRAKVQEHQSKRFELGDIVIIEKLKALPFKTSHIGDKVISFYPEDESYPYEVQVLAGPPFTVQFIYNKQVVVILDADKLVMENSDASEAFTFKVDFPGSTRLYGLLDHAYKMSLGKTNNGSDNSMDPFRLRNSDSWAYEANSPMALYGARPVIFGHSKEKTSAIFLHNAAEQWIDVNSEDTEQPSAYFMVERAAFDLFVLLGPTPKDIVRQFTTLTGRAHLPQIWALGYHQCRFSYKSQDDVKEVVALLDKNNFPWDAIYLDGDHTDGYRWFHWNSTTYTDPVEMLNNISATGRVAVSISDPHIKVEDSYDVYIGAKEKYFTKWKNGSNYEANCWPDLSSWIDFMIPKASDYYASWYSYKKFNGSTPALAGIWNDMNEPAVFDDNTEKTMPFDVLHAGKIPHGDIHNIYGLTQTRATHKGLMDRDEGKKRPFILTRSHFAGSQRYAAMWTGDNSASWEHFANSYSECMTANLMGMVFCGADIGGFIKDPSMELLQRWYQGAVWLPFFRGHSSRESKRREPYLLPKEVQTVLRNTLRLRYRHVPVFYTLFYEHTRTGDPIIRPLYYQYPEIEDMDTQVLVGTDIMGVAVTQPNVSSVEVYFPDKNSHWYRIDDDSAAISVGGIKKKVDVNITTSPVFYRAGSIIFRKDIPRKSAVAAIDDPFAVYVNLDQNNEASGRLYVDDYYSFNYTDKNNYLYVSFTYDNDLHALRMSTIDGDNTGLNALIEQIVINRLKVSDEGIFTSHQVIFDKTYDGIPLSGINIGPSLNENEELIIKL
ncbi:unnamed protein product [Psylliodes chrysocephalus]|uniref:Glucosidase II subunit alpha n=1 Tax=Psylliodes chrysocephalus TaxID=3402493 RepID=A0A9P0D693_9CUCU|nr:unnamed protein product [Psylliodes chrysocephala]